MRQDREFFINLAPPITPVEVALFALNIRTLYTTILLEDVGSRLQRECHERDPMYSYEDQLGFECRLPLNVLREQVIMQPVEIGFLPSSAHGHRYVAPLISRLQKIMGTDCVDHIARLVK